MVAALFAVSWVAASSALGSFRAAGIQPSFYQANFEPVVMMACGRGFVSAPADPPALEDFLRLRHNTFDCTALSPDLPRVPVTTTANANWYYLYATTAAIWRTVGISWTALDGLVAALAATATIFLYGLFRLVSGAWVSAGLTLLLTLSPANLGHVLSLRDYSKAPFVLAAIFLLGVLVLRPMRGAATLAIAAAYGAVVGFGYGFRSDLAVMVPFGVVIVLLFLPGSLKSHIGRNGLAAALLAAVFVLVAWPVIQRLDSGGCQYHFALLGLTTSAAQELHLVSPLYRFGDQALDMFANLKVGDYASRVMHAPVPELCSAEYDAASGQLFAKVALTFPADLVVHAYASVLMILRMGLSLPRMVPPAPPFAGSAVMAGLYRALDAITSPLGPLGVVVTLAAMAAAWASSFRHGAAFTVFVLFLAGYPAIRFEERHWFHLRFIPWWAAAFVCGELARRGVRGWTRPVLVRGVLGVAGVLAMLVLALGAVRLVQVRTVRALVAGYQTAATEPLPVDRRDASFLAVAWQPHDDGVAPEHRGSDLLVVTLDPQRCAAGQDTLSVVVQYAVDAQGAGHDLSTTFVVERPRVGTDPTRLFVPIFWTGFHDTTYLRFAGIDVVGASTACVRSVARIADRQQLPLWVEMQVSPGWAGQRLYQTIDPPPVLKPMIKTSL